MESPPLNYAAEIDPPGNPRWLPVLTVSSAVLFAAALVLPVGVGGTSLRGYELIMVAAEGLFGRGTKTVVRGASMCAIGAAVAQVGSLILLVQALARGVPAGGIVLEIAARILGIIVLLVLIWLVFAFVLLIALRGGMANLPLPPPGPVCWLISAVMLRIVLLRLSRRRVGRDRE